MRTLINILNEEDSSNQPNSIELTSMKSVIASKIKELPDDDATAKALREIEELLTHIHAGGKMGMINGELSAIHDPTITGYQKKLARYIYGLEATPEQRKELFTLWRADKLLNIEKLLTKGKRSFSDLVNKYDTNPLIKEIVNDMMREQALGQGKGEFGLSILSKRINKQAGKGDLNIAGRAIELKTTDGGAARFTDQEVRPAAGFEQAARDLNTFVIRELGTKLPSSGLNLGVAVDLYQTIPEKRKKQFLAMVANVVQLIFGGKTASKEDIKGIVNGIKSGQVGQAQQAYAVASYNYYMSSKDDEGVLYIDLTKEPIETVFFRDAKELAKDNLRLDAGTVYLTSIKDVRLPYPQTKIVTTTFGANARASAEKQAHAAAVKAASAKNMPVSQKVSGKRAPTKAEVTQMFTDYATGWARVNGIPTTARTINGLVNIITVGRLSGLSNTAIEKQLKAQIPGLQPAQVKKSAPRQRRPGEAPRQRR